MAAASAALRACRGGRCDHWIKVKNRQHPAMSRVQSSFSEDQR
jgi:hypothetical protein